MDDSISRDASGNVTSLVLRLGLRLLAIGLPLGIAGAVAVSNVIRGVLFKVTPYDPLTLVTIPLLLSAVIIAGCLLPARRAARLNPVEALRTE